MGFYGSRIPPYAERIPLASAIVYREGDYAIAKIWNEQWGRWSRIAKSTDHAGVIQSAIDYVGNFGGGKVLIKKGEYILQGKGLELKGYPIIIEGETESVTLTFTGVSDLTPGIHLIRSHEVGYLPTEEPERKSKFMGVKNLRLLGGSTRGTGIYAEYVKKLLVENVYVENTKSHGIAIGWIGTGSVGYTVDQFAIVNVELHETKGTIMNSAQNGVIANIKEYDYDIANAGMWFHYSDTAFPNRNIVVLNAYLEVPTHSNDSKGILFEYAENVCVVNPVIKGYYRGIWLGKSGLKDIKIIGGKIYDCVNGIMTGAAITLDHPETIEFDGIPTPGRYRVKLIATDEAVKVII